MVNVERALLVAERAHQGQPYGDIYPYIFHVKQVVEIAEDFGYDEEIVVSCALHDVLEDSYFSPNDIKRAFGEEVADIVWAVTNEGRDREEKHERTHPKIKASWKATVVKICDRIANASHSKLYNEKMWKLYKKEHEQFKYSIMSHKHPKKMMHVAWFRLESVMTSK